MHFSSATWRLRARVSISPSYIHVHMCERIRVRVMPAVCIGEREADNPAREKEAVGARNRSRNPDKSPYVPVRGGYIYRQN